MASEQSPDPPRASGLRRLWLALHFSMAGLRHAATHEAAVRDELIAIAVLVPAAIALPVPAIERLLLVLLVLLLVVVELLNSAVERTVDRISAERHPLAGQAKDMGSAAVFVVMLMNAIAWAVIAGPLALAWVRALSD